MRLPDHRGNLLRIYEAALSAVEGRRVVADFLRGHEIPGPVHVVAIGKAAASMARGAHDRLGDAISAALVVTRHGYGQDVTRYCPHFRLLEAGHPVPDQSSLEAGQALLAFLQQVPGDGVLLFLLSGGTSSLVEVLPTGLGLADLRRANAWLLASGLPIDRVNAVRRALSCIKGGRLIRCLPDVPVWNLLISDVPGDDPAVIGSGLLVAQSEVSSRSMSEQLPLWLRKLMEKAPACSVEKSRSAPIETAVIANNQLARRAAAGKARAMGYHVCLHEQDVQGEVSMVARELLHDMDKGTPALHIWGGETTVRLPAEPGQGGRCQHLALQLARLLQNRQQGACIFLAAGTDGSDGPGEAAGALVDHQTIDRGQRERLDASDCLQRADAGSFLQASHDLLCTGVTGTNVMDLVLGLPLRP